MIIRKYIFKILICILFLFTISLNTESYAKYKIESVKKICNLQIDKIPPVCLIEYSIDKLTNNDVTIYVKMNEEVQEIEGWILDEDGKKAYKTLEQNESGMIKVRDLAGNISKVEYHVDWIDKEPPEINGVENEECVNKYLNLEYTDNIEVAEIIKNKIGDLELYINYFFQNISESYKKGFNKNEITVEVRTIPQGATNFAYYINGMLEAISDNKVYTFKNLEEGKKYEFRAEATVDGEIKKSNTREQRTAIFDDVLISEENNILNLNIKSINEKIDNIRISVWNDEYGQDDLIHYYIKDINTENIDYKINIENHDNKKGIYNIHLYMFDINGNELGVYPGRYQFLEDREAEYEFNKDGTYKVMVKDTAGNKTEKIFTIDIDDIENPIVEIKSVIENNNYLVKIVELKDKSRITKIEYIRNGVVEYFVEKDEITIADINDYIFEKFDNDFLCVKVYDEIGNCQIVKL